MNLLSFIRPHTAKIPCKRRQNADYRCDTDWSHPCSGIWGADGNRLRTRRAAWFARLFGANFFSPLKKCRRVILYTTPCVLSHNEVN